MAAVCHPKVSVLIRCCGRFNITIHMKQYLPKKQVKRGFKVWMIADSCNGFFLDMEGYVGKPSDGVTSEIGLGKRVVLQLSKPFRGQHFHIFISPNLFLELYSRGLNACGTVRQDSI